MRFVLNHFLPVVQDDINGVCLNAGTRSSSALISNGYYGYQPVTGNNDHVERMDTQTCKLDIHFNNMIEAPPPREHICWANTNTINRKRGWEYGGDLRDFKKRRENEPLSNIPVQPTSKCLNLRQPTHNVPDMPRSIMEKLTRNVKLVKENDDSLEELLFKTHGCNFYHWNGHEL